MHWNRLPFARRTRRRGASLLALAAVVAACSRPAAAPAGPPAVPVEVVTLQPRPVEQTTEFVGTVKSRRSTTVQPQVEGFVTRILVQLRRPRRAGRARSCRSTPACSRRRSANLESHAGGARGRPATTRSSRPTRMKTLLEAGAVSQPELEQAQTALSTAEAQLKAIEAQIRQQQRGPRLLPGDRAHRRRRGRHPGARRATA